MAGSGQVYYTLRASSANMRLICCEGKSRYLDGIMPYAPMARLYIISDIQRKPSGYVLMLV